MVLYIFMPVAAFYGYHQVTREGIHLVSRIPAVITMCILFQIDHFQDTLLQYRRRTTTPEIHENNKLIAKAIQVLHDQRDESFRQELQEFEQRSKQQ